ncbi:MAG: lamin tail domain-containing protein [Saprospiraceae bacterium]|nr:lamin tail domain-containing protein [Saprospiraceae bacterium]
MKTFYALLFGSFLLATTLSGQVAIQEIMYNPPEPGTDTLEYLELVNLTDIPVDLTGYSFSAGVVYNFPSILLPAYGYTVICKDSIRFSAVFGLTAYEWATGSLDNSGETVILINAQGQTVDSVSYSDQGGWPGLPTDGNGSSLVLCDVFGDHNDPANWQAASTPTGIFINGIELKANPLAASDCSTADEKALILTGVFDAQPMNAGAKGVEVFLRQDVTDLSLYGIGSANNGNGSNGVEFTFPAIAGTAGTFYYIAVDSALFHDFFGFKADFTSQAVNINGDDAIEVFENAVVIDVFGDINVDGTGKPWEYLDGWVYRVNGTGPDGSTFEPDHWIYSGLNALKGSPTNQGAPTPFPVGTYDPNGTIVLVANDDYVSTDQNKSLEIQVQANDFKPNPILTFELLELPDHGSAMISNSTAITYSPDTDYCGPDQLTYRLCDQDGCDTATAFITVICPKIYPIYDIGQVTTINAVGILDSVQTECQLEGVVYGGNLRPGGLQFTLIDDLNDGISVFSANDFGYGVTEGDRIIVQGRIIQYNGLAEILPDTVWQIGSNEMLFNPEVVTTFSESVESQLIQVQFAQLVDASEWTNSGFGFNVRIFSGTDTMIMRIDSDVDLFGQPAPSGVFHVTGLGTQFDETSPYLEDYQIMPRYLQDIDQLNSIEQPEEIIWSLYPNPVTDICYLHSETVLQSVRILDVLGRNIGIVTEAADGLDWIIDLQSSSAGMYWVQGLTADGQIIAQPVLRSN